MYKWFVVTVGLLASVVGLTHLLSQPSVPPLLPEEGKRLSQLRQLTFEGTNAEAYWSPDGEWLVFQCLRPPYKAD